MVGTLFGLTIASAFLGVPLLAILGLQAAISFHFITQVPLEAMITKVQGLMSAPGILAMPIFTFMGFILSYGKTSQRIADSADAWFGWLPGGLAIATVIAYTIFCSITGGSALAIMALGGIYYSALIKDGYDKNFSLGICTVCGGEGMLFPPSVPVIIMAFIAYESIDALYAGGLLPGLMVVGIFLVYCVIHSVRSGIPSKPFSFKKAWGAVLDIGLEIPLPVFIVVGIFSGWITVTEVAALSLAYVIIAECLIRREVSWQEFKKASLESMVLTGAIFAILVSALAFSNFLVDDQIPQKFLEFLQHYITSKLVFLIFLNIILLITGCLMDVYSAILVMVPLLLPVSKGYGIDPIHFAVIFLWNLEIGYSTPPIGFNLFIGAFRFKEPLETLWRAALPRLAVQVLGLLIITYWPGLSLWLPKVLGMRQELIPFNLMGG